MVDGWTKAKTKEEERKRKRKVAARKNTAMMAEVGVVAEGKDRLLVGALDMYIVWL